MNHRSNKSLIILFICFILASCSYSSFTKANKTIKKNGYIYFENKKIPLKIKFFGDYVFDNDLENPRIAWFLTNMNGVFNENIFGKKDFLITSYTDVEPIWSNSIILKRKKDLTEQKLIDFGFKKNILGEKDFFEKEKVIENNCLSIRVYTSGENWLFINFLCKDRFPNCYEINDICNSIEFIKDSNGNK